MANLQTITVFAGSADEPRKPFLDAAFQLGALLAQKGLTLVYGGGKTGLMGALADGALQAGGEVIGVISANLNLPRLAHPGLKRMEVFPTIHERQTRLIDLGDALLALPGGFGTWSELFEALTWAQIGLHHKPIGLLNTAGYYDLLLAMVSHAVQEGFLFPEHRALFRISPDPARLLAELEDFTPPAGLSRWLERP